MPVAQGRDSVASDSPLEVLTHPPPTLATTMR